jgi:hypothetical protein
MPDVFQTIDSIDAAKQSMIAERLEYRAAMPKFVAVRNAYFEAIDLPSVDACLNSVAAQVQFAGRLRLGQAFRGEITGSDL